MSTGFEIINQQLWTVKDPEAQLTYTFDWVEWLPTGDSIVTSNYTITARVNDPDPLIKVSQGISGTKTYVELKEGQIGKSYVVSVVIVTANGLKERRNFKVKIENRSA
jgi:hypothetical protein